VNRIFRPFIACLVVLGLFASAAVAQDYPWKPNRPITIIVPWAAGGSTDQVIRVLAPELEKALGVSVVVVNQPGASGSIGTLTRFTRSAVLEVLAEDFVRTARSKGLRGRSVVIRHVLRAALVPVVTLIGLMFGNILSGAVLVEAVFSWPGVGRYAFLSANNLDVPAIAGVAMFVGVVYVLTNLVVDLLYGAIDPRIRVDG
jgi:ABC-type microcin C transport system permease subunit YejB